MSEIWWDLRGTDNRCSRYGPGHWVHWIHHKKYAQEPGALEPVTVTDAGDGVFVLQGGELPLRCWNHRPELVRRALQRSRGAALWQHRCRLLVVPTGAAVNGASNVFNLGPAEDRTPCPPSTNHIPEAWRTGPKPSWITAGGGLPMAPRYASRRPGSSTHTTTTTGEHP